ncbi:hypothetical protein SAMN04489712_10321 [Thermomonospora echinospora]|uniref:SaeA fourth Fn3-like domain-containing protein n=1 Tax=Thermomonospora echinospora TaxID=1992 RepID=A0A1H5WYZ7_9ACTN|nr:hypothetical protein [Thermomonospora echinospora]SEG04708.1 hypothetical protein SAMN04489712_10321 [Thermomonospora echinospora]
MGFDDDYKREVLEPARAAGDQPPEDLRVRYRLGDPLVPGQVAEQVRQVRQCWRRSRGQLKYRKLIDRLEAEHRELAPLFAAAERGDLRPLTERLRGGRERTERRLADARARLADAAGGLRMVTPAEVEELARAAGTGRAELAAAAAADRIEIREPDRLPLSPPYAGYRKVRESLDVLGHRHLAEFLFGDAAGPIQVLGGFAAPGAPAGPAALPEAVREAAEQWARRTRDSSSTHAGTVLVALRAVPPDDLVLYDVVARLRERRRQRASEGALLRHAVEDLGIEPGDARRLVFAVLRESGPGGGPADRLRALLDAGEVYAAALLGESLDEEDGPDVPPEAELLAEEARQRVAAAVRLRDAAGAERDPDRAWRMLADALALVRDLPGAEEHQRRLPPRPVPRVEAVAEGTGVRLDWAPSPSTVGEITYEVVRRRGRSPGGDGDGDPVASGATGAFDVRPPVNVPLYYGVLARRGEAVAPIACTGPVVVRPEPQSVELVAGDGAVTGRWTAPPGAARILVTRDGRPVPAERDGFREPVPNGITHHYRICAVYADGEGREVVTPGVVASATPNAPPEPVRELTVESDPADPARALARFAQPAGGTVEIVMLDAPPPWRPGTLLPVAEVRHAARRVPATPTSRGLALRPGGGGWLLAVTVAGDTAAIGACHRHVNLPPLPALVAERRGEAVHVGFDWPDDIAEVEVAYRAGTGSPADGRLVVTRAAYEARGGIHLPVPPDLPVTVTVAPAGMRQGSRVVGPAVEATVPARLQVRYDLERSGPPWKRSLTIRLLAPRPLRLARLTLVHRPGQVAPQRPEDGRALGSWDEVPVPGELSVSAPRDRGPYWLRCFADDDSIELVDPPVRRLEHNR